MLSDVIASRKGANSVLKHLLEMSSDASNYWIYQIQIKAPYLHDLLLCISGIMLSRSRNGDENINESMKCILTE